MTGSDVDKKKFEKYYLTLKGRACHMLQNARRRAKLKNLKITITQDWIIQELNKGKCQVTNIPFNITINGGKGHKHNHFSPSLDRIDQNGDYTPENCRVTVWMYNRARGLFPDDAFKIMIIALAESYKKEA